MLRGIENLKALTPADWPRVRDISIPFQRCDKAPDRRPGSIQADLQSAVAFIGATHARRLCNQDDTAMTLNLVELVGKAEPFLKQGHDRFRLEHQGHSFRVQVGRNAEQWDLQMRVLPQETPSLSELQMPPTWRELMQSETLCNGGLILITGPTGQGKTTTAAAMVRTRLELFGGMANTVEDPIELPLQGVWGQGICYQRPSAREVDHDGPGAGYHRSLMDALRQFPAISGGCTQLFVGEIQDGRTASETLKAAANGHLVIATIHGKTSISAVRRLLSLAADREHGLAHNHVKEMLSECIRGVFNQRLIWKLTGQGWDSASIDGDLMWSSGFDSTVAGTIRARYPEDLATIVAHQTSTLNAVQADARPAEIRAAIAQATGEKIEAF